MPLIHLSLVLIVHFTDISLISHFADTPITPPPLHTTLPPSPLPSILTSHRLLLHHSRISTYLSSTPGHVIDPTSKRGKKKPPQVRRKRWIRTVIQTPPSDEQKPAEKNQTNDVKEKSRMSVREEEKKEKTKKVSSDKTAVESSSTAAATAAAAAATKSKGNGSTTTTNTTRATTGTKTGIKDGIKDGTKTTASTVKSGAAAIIDHNDIDLEEGEEEGEEDGIGAGGVDYAEFEVDSEQDSDGDDDDGDDDDDDSGVHDVVHDAVHTRLPPPPSSLPPASASLLRPTDQDTTRYVSVPAPVAMSPKSKAKALKSIQSNAQKHATGGTTACDQHPCHHPVKMSDHCMPSYLVMTSH